MRVLNLYAKFNIGTTIKVKSDYKNGSLILVKGTTGIVNKITIESFPDLNIFDLRIIHMHFGKNNISMGEDIARTYFEIV